MYAIKKQWEILYILDEKPTQEKIKEMGGDECVDYNQKTPRPVVLENLKTGSNDLEWYEFSDIEIGDIITARVFGGNPYAQMVLQAKATEAMFRKMVGQSTPEDDAIIEKKSQVMTAVNQIRALFSLSPM